MKTVLILGANSDTAKEALALYVRQGHQVIAASRTLSEIDAFIKTRNLPEDKVITRHFDATAFGDHAAFYAGLIEDVAKAPKDKLKGPPPSR